MPVQTALCTESASIGSSLAAGSDLDCLQQLAGGIAHHLNNALTPILGFSACPATPEDLSASDRAGLAAIHQAALELERLSRSLLAFSGRSVLHRRPLDLRAVLSRSADEQAFPEPPGVSMEVPPMPVVVSADERQLQQALASLIGVGGGAPAAVNIALEDTGAFARLDIDTTAFDSTDSAWQSLFEPRFRFEPHPGLALDLPAAYGIIAGHGGSVSAIPIPGGGIRFVVVLPLDKTQGVPTG